jgi:hypothetical protein
MSAGWTQRHRDLMCAVAEGRIECDMTRGAWEGPDYKRRMGCYSWIGSGPCSFRDVEALIELRQAAKILTIPEHGKDRWPVKPTPQGEEWVARLITRRAVRS